MDFWSVEVERVKGYGLDWLELVSEHVVFVKSALRMYEIIP